VHLKVNVLAWYYLTAIIAALVIIVPGIGKGANGLVRTIRYIASIASMPRSVAKQHAEIGALRSELEAFREVFRKHAQDDLAFQTVMVQQLGANAQRQFANMTAPKEAKP
jgi:hypothetical protein